LSFITARSKGTYLRLARVDLDASASKKVSFVIPMSLLGYTGISGNFVIEPGQVEVGAGSSSYDIQSSAKFNVTGKTRTIGAEDRAFLSVATIDPNE
jgi:beta-xylosidase